MVTQQRTKKQIGFEDEAFDAVRELLAEFGISPHSVDEYREEDVVKAIHERGWEYQIERDDEEPGWFAEITEWRATDQSQSAVGSDPDRVMALFRALRHALVWTTPEQEWSIFNEHAQKLLGISGSEFLERLKSGDLPTDDPRVTHLLIIRPLGT